MELADLEKRQLRFVIRQFQELKSILNRTDALEKTEHRRILGEVSAILRKFRSGFFGCEERTEYQSARNFRALEEAFRKVAPELDSKQHQEISKLLGQAQVYNASLEKLASRGGLIEKSLKILQNNEQNLKLVQQQLHDALAADLSFEAVINELIALSKTIKKFYAKFSGYRETSWALIAIGDRILVLYDQDQFHRESANFDDLLVRINNPQTRVQARKEEEVEDQKARTIPDDSGFFSDRISYLESRMVDNVILGYCEFSWKYKKEQFLGAYEIFRIATKPGLGLLFLELILSWASLRHAPAILDRKNTSPAIRKLWEYIDTEKPQVLKYPAALLKYPLAVGYTKNEAIEVFGPAVITSSVFDENGFPHGISKDNLRQLQEKIGNIRGMSYLQKEKMASTNQVVGGIASLDKAYYYDGEKILLAGLLKKGFKDAKNRWNVVKFKNAGYVFFQESKSRSGLMK